MSLFEPDTRPATAWPSNGIPHNRWFKGLHRFIIMLKHFHWPISAEHKYVNLRIDTRDGSFLVIGNKPSCDCNRSHIDPDDIAKHVDMNKVDRELAKMIAGTVTTDVRSLLHTTVRELEYCREKGYAPDATTIGRLRELIDV
jgi:hypothetical protein